MRNKKVPHIHSELIKAWADGAKIQFLGDISGTWMDCTPTWQSHLQYRIKPEPKPDRVAFSNVYKNSIGCLSKDSESLDKWARAANEIYLGRVRVTFDGETGKLKSVEIIK